MINIKQAFYRALDKTMHSKFDPESLIAQSFLKVACAKEPFADMEKMIFLIEQARDTALDTHKSSSLGRQVVKIMNHTIIEIKLMKN